MSRGWELGMGPAPVHYRKHSVIGPAGREGLGHGAYGRSRDWQIDGLFSDWEGQRVSTKSSTVNFQFSEVAYILVLIRSRLHHDTGKDNGRAG